jgi:hypothetical protein
VAEDPGEARARAADAAGELAAAIRQGRTGAARDPLARIGQILDDLEGGAPPASHTLIIPARPGQAIADGITRALADASGKPPDDSAPPGRQ